jgi:hypothetical protein
MTSRANAGSSIFGGDEATHHQPRPSPRVGQQQQQQQQQQPAKDNIFHTDSYSPPHENLNPGLQLHAGGGRSVSSTNRKPVTPGTARAMRERRQQVNFGSRTVMTTMMN